jgi:hypothetical protein
MIINNYYQSSSLLLLIKIMSSLFNLKPHSLLDLSMLVLSALFLMRIIKYNLKLLLLLRDYFIIKKVLNT